mmetsp:Transcript_44137/g.117735  ORF Transcript_44137/g.117735 Transcript_44137/m.117735 type:complete len:121 (+) Transcript_44137:139-501(+)
MNITLEIRKMRRRAQAMKTYAKCSRCALLSNPCSSEKPCRNCVRLGKFCSNSSIQQQEWANDQAENKLSFLERFHISSNASIQLASFDGLSRNNLHHDPARTVEERISLKERIAIGNLIN